MEFIALNRVRRSTAAGDGVYELGKLPVTVTGGVPTLADGSLAGSTLTMDTAFRNMAVYRAVRLRAVSRVGHRSGS